VVGIPVIDAGPMTVDEFYVFTDTRPDDEKWELIGGEPVLNAAPSPLHQLIVRNVVFALMIRERENKAPWIVLPGLGVRVSEKGSASPHYVAISQDAVEVSVFARDDEFGGRKFRSVDKTIDLRSLDISLSIAEIYRDTGLV
jgi:Uma2 family endonuclease